MAKITSDIPSDIKNSISKNITTLYESLMIDDFKFEGKFTKDKFVELVVNDFNDKVKKESFKDEKERNRVLKLITDAIEVAINQLLTSDNHIKKDIEQIQEMIKKEKEEKKEKESDIPIGDGSSKKSRREILKSLQQNLLELQKNTIIRYALKSLRSSKKEAKKEEASNIVMQLGDKAKKVEELEAEKAKQAEIIKENEKAEQLLFKLINDVSDKIGKLNELPEQKEIKVIEGPGPGQQGGNTYKHKYLKYKTKYLTLKNLQ